MLIQERPNLAAGRICGRLLRASVGTGWGLGEACTQLVYPVCDSVRSSFQATWGVIGPGINRQLLLNKEKPDEVSG